MKKYLLVLALISTLAPLSAQNLKIGVRAGLNYFKTLGDLESQETQSFTSGFHFGINGTYYFNDVFGLRAELLYIQKGSLTENTGTIYTIFKPSSFTLIPKGRTVEYGQGSYTLKRTYNTFSIPLQATIRPIQKIELFAGLNIDFIAGSTGSGNIDISNNDPNAPFSFKQSLEYNYNTDLPGGFNQRNAKRISINYDTDGDGDVELMQLPQSVGAYFYDGANIEGNAIKSFDLGVNAGLSYYINPGLYLRGTFDFGLLDITNVEFDYSLQEANDDATFIYRDDFDRKMGFQFSVGFQF